VRPLLLVLAMACTGKQAPPGDSQDPIIDVSDLECAGLEWTEDGVPMSVPTTTTDGCDGGRVLGALTCVGSECGDSGHIEISANVHPCLSIPLSPDGTFDAGVLAPYSYYSFRYFGILANGDGGSWSGGTPVCSDDITLTGDVFQNASDSGS